MTKAMTAASVSLYDIVNRQCDVLSASMKGSCRLVQLNVGGTVNVRSAPTGGNMTANATATFEVEAPFEASPQ